MITWRLHTLASLTSANATLRYGRKFSLSIQDWRAISTLGSFAPLSMKDLASRAQLEKGFASRTVSGLVERGFVLSKRSESDGRGVTLELSAAGKKLYKRVFVDAVARNENYLIGFTAKQRATLFELIGLMTANARRMVELEKKLVDEPSSHDGNLAELFKKEVPAPDVFSTTAHTAEIRYLVTRLSQLMGLG